MTVTERRALERAIRRQILAVDDIKTQDVLFSLLALVIETSDRQPVTEN
jgi:hypothetical protein